MVRAGAISDLCEHQALLPLVLLDVFFFPMALVGFFYLHALIIT